MNPKDPKSSDPPETAPNPEIDAFFQRLPGSLHWPPPTEAAIAAAVEAIQRTAGTELRTARSPQEPSARDSTNSAGICSGCGQALANAMRFCGNCGLPVPEQTNGLSQNAEPEMSLQADEAGSSFATYSRQSAAGAPPAQHHYHHHYHHFVGAAGSASAPTQLEPGAPHGRASSPASSGSRAELAAKQLAQDWAQSCNTKHLDDLVDLYLPDATLIRSNVLPVRSAASIREFLFAALEAGLGDVEMSSLRTEIFGEIALDLGRCKMLVPVAMGKRREERGKYLLVMARQPAGHWKIIADCWSTDLSVSTAPAAEVVRKPSDAAAKKAR